MKRFSFILFLLVGYITSFYAETLVVDNTTRDYIIYVPKNLGSQRPLLISCHGMNQDAAYQKGMLQIESIADTAKFVTVFPNGINNGWDISGDRDLRFVQAIIDEMVAKYDIDRNRVYLSGFSMGGMFTYHAMNRIADKIAAFAPISGYPMGGGVYTSSRPLINCGSSVQVCFQSFPSFKVTVYVLGCSMPCGSVAVNCSVMDAGRIPSRLFPSSQIFSTDLLTLPGV